MNDEQAMNTAERLAEGFQLQSEGQLPQAKAIYEEILKAEPNNPDALYLIGMLAFQSGHVQPATQYLIHAVNNGCSEASLYTNLSKILRKQNKTVDAHNVIVRGYQVHPNDGEILVALAISLYDRSDFESARAALLRALEINEDDAQAHYELARTYQAIGSYELSQVHYLKAISLNPNMTTYNMYASLLVQMEQEEKAIEQLNRSLEISPMSEPTLNDLGFYLYTLGRLDASIDAFERCLAINPSNPDAHGLLAFPLLLKGDYAKGWKEYEWRFKTPSFPIAPITLQSPVWNNEPIKGKTILLLAEQGYGDTFQFVRYAAQLSNRGATVLVAAQAPAVEILKSAPGVSDVFAFDHTPVPDHDYHIHMMSLPERLGTTLDTIPNAVPYLSADPELAKTWEQRLAGYAGLKVGVVWSGNPAQRNNPKRSAPLAALAPMLETQGVQFFSLAKDRDEREGPLPENVIDLGPEIESFSDTAAILVNLDLVISVCTSSAHLAGMLALPTWIMLAEHADWRWLLERTDNPWYPTARLFRQKTLHDWDQVANDIAQALGELT